MHQITLTKIHKVPPVDSNGKPGLNQQAPEDPFVLLDTSVPANAVLIGPASGVNSKPTYRKLTLADLPSGIGGGSTYTVSNGLTLDVNNNITLGGTLDQPKPNFLTPPPPTRIVIPAGSGQMLQFYTDSSNFLSINDSQFSGGYQYLNNGGFDESSYIQLSKSVANLRASSVAEDASYSVYSEIWLAAGGGNIDTWFRSLDNNNNQARFELIPTKATMGTFDANVDGYVTKIDVINDAIYLTGGNVQVDALAGTGIRNMVVDGSGNLSTQPNYTQKPGATVVLQRLEAGVITDNLITTSKNGALSTATYSKNGDFDKVAVTGGDSSSFITFPNRYITDTQCSFKASIKVENLNADATSGTSYFGIGLSGVQGSQDTGSNFGSIAFVDLIGKTATQVGFGTNAMTVASSPTTLLTSGDVLDIEYRRDQVLGGTILFIINRTSGAYFVAKITGLDAIDCGLHNGVLKLIMSNATYTLLDVRVEASVPRNPLLHVIGDSMGLSYHLPVSQTINALFPAQYPYPMISSNGNGAMWDSIDRFQMQDVLKIQSKYVLVMSILPVQYGAANSSNGNYAAFKAHWDHVMGAITAYGGIPIVTLWPTSTPFGIATDWNNFVNAQASVYTSLKTLDLSGAGLNFGDQYGHLSASDWASVTSLLINLLQISGN